MEVAPHELAQLLKLAGVGVGPEPEVMSEPDMPGAEIEPEVSVMAIPSDDGAPVGGGCGAPEPEHDHDHGGKMRSIIDMLQGAGEEPIEVEESPPKDDYENASNEFTGHPVDVIDTYDQYSYEPAKNSGMQRRTNSYGDNPLREDDLIKEYTEFKKKPLTELSKSTLTTTTGTSSNPDKNVTVQHGATEDDREKGSLDFDKDDGFGSGFGSNQTNQQTTKPKFTNPDAEAQWNKSNTAFQQADTHNQKMADYKKNNPNWQDQLATGSGGNTEVYKPGSELGKMLSTYAQQATPNKKPAKVVNPKAAEIMANQGLTPGNPSAASINKLVNPKTQPAKTNALTPSRQQDIETKYKELGLDQGDDPLSGWYDTRGMSDEDIAAGKQKRINDRIAQMARDEGGGGIVAGDIEKGKAINKAKQVAAADASFDKGTETPDFGQQQIAKRDASWEKGIDNPPQQVIARGKTPPTDEIAQGKKYRKFKDELDRRRADKVATTGQGGADSILDKSGNIDAQYPVATTGQGGADANAGVSAGKPIERSASSVDDLEGPEAGGPGSRDDRESKVVAAAGIPDPYANYSQNLANRGKATTPPGAGIKTTVINPDDDQTVGQQVALTPDQRKAAIKRAEPYSGQNDWAPPYYAKQSGNYVADPAIAPPVDTSADNDDEDEYDSSQDDNSSAIAGNAIDRSEFDQRISPKADERTDSFDAPADDESEMGTGTGDTGDKPEDLTISGSTPGGKKVVSTGDATISNTKSKLASLNPNTQNILAKAGLKSTIPAVQVPSKDNKPKSGETLQSIAARMGFPSIQAFIDAQPKGSIGRMKSGPNLGNYFVKKDRSYNRNESVVGLSRNINRLKFLAGI